MKTLKSVLLMVLLAGGVAAQTSVKESDTAPDVEVVKIIWRRVERNPKLDETPAIPNPERALRMAVNSARISAAEQDRRNQTGPVSPPVLLPVPPVPDSPPTVRPWSGYIYEFTVRNTGSKTIRKLAWEYSFTDAATGRKVGRRQYKSDVKILPGMTAKVVVRSSLPPIGTVNAALGDGNGGPDKSPEQMVINRIQYADGSIWKRTAK